MNSAPPETHVFETKSLIPCTMPQILGFHQDPNALPALTPPPIITRLQEDQRVSLTSGDLKFTLWFTLIPVRWHARHEPGPTPHSFADLMIDGPMGYWRHEHIFTPTSDGVLLTDRVTLAHKPGLTGLFTRLIFDGLPLRFLFLYRHFRTRLAVKSYPTG